MSNWKQIPVTDLGEFVIAALELAAENAWLFAYQQGAIRFLAVDDGTPRWIFEGLMNLPGAGTGTRCQLIMVNGGTFDVHRFDGEKFVPVSKATADFGIMEARRLAQSLPEVVTMGFGIDTNLLRQLWKDADVAPGAVVGRLHSL